MHCGAPKKLAVAVLLAVTLVWSAAAQEKIIFSKPADASGTPKDDSNVAPETQHQTRSLFSLPSSIFEIRSPDQAFPAVSASAPQPSRVSPEQQKAWDNALDKKNKWILMTPEEILGIPTPEKILGLPDKNGDDNLSVEERYTRRQERTAAGLLVTAAAANAERRSEPWFHNHESIFDHKVFESPFAQPDGKKSATEPLDAQGKPNKVVQLLGSLLNSPFAAPPKPEFPWGNTFNLPSAPPKPTPEQLAGMERFRQSLEPSAVFEKAAEPLRMQAPTAPVRDPFMDAAPASNPHGRSFAPLRNEAARPHGLTPLPGIATRLPEKPRKSEAQSQLPPWMREDSENNLGTPYRKF